MDGRDGTGGSTGGDGARAGDGVQAGDSGDGRGRRLGENTRAVHLPPPPVPAEQPFGTPIYRTAAFAFRSAEDYADVLNDRVPGYTD